jgi:glycosyltransferase involved in cell wall biosynthesis
MRFAWQYQAYASGSSLSLAARVAGKLLGTPLRAWDRRTSQRPDVLVANSRNIRDRIKRFWGRDSEVVFPPVDIDEFDVPTHDGGYLLVAARLLAYRRVDLAVDASTQSGRELVVVGDGPERRSLEARAGKSVRFDGAVSRERLVELMAGCRAYVVPGEEDFGIAPIEAMACGKPVVALGRGGTAETVVDGVTGVHFTDQTPHGLVEAMERLDSLSLDTAQIRANAQRFGTPRFRDEFRDLFRRLGVDPALYALG